MPFPEPDRQLFSDVFFPFVYTCQDSFEFDGSLLFFARAWRVPNGRNLALWALLSALALLTQYFAGFLVAAEALALLYRARSRAAFANKPMSAPISNQTKESSSMIDLPTC